MLAERVENSLRNVPAIAENGLKISRAIHQAVLQGGRGLRNAVDLLHGVWLGHPLHPMLTDVAIGAWSFSAYFDLLSLANGSRKSQHAADSLLQVGNLSALPTAAAGLADFSTIPQGVAGVGLLHGLLNTAAYTLFLGSQLARARNLRTLGIALSFLAAGLMFASAYLGGHLSFKHKVGVNHAQQARGPQQWTPVLPADQLADGQPQRIEHNGQPILLYRHQGHVYATGAVCPHAGGPLEEGDFQGACVQCPWHDSVFDLRDGAIVHGPSAYPLTAYQTRLHNAQIEIRLTP